VLYTPDNPPPAVWDEAIAAIDHLGGDLTHADAVGLRVAMQDDGLDAGACVHAWIELSIGGPYGRHDYSAADLARLLAMPEDRHTIDDASPKAVEIAAQRAVLAAAGIIEIIDLPNGATITRIGDRARQVLDAAAAQV